MPSEWCHDDAETSTSINFNIRLLILKKSLLIKTLLIFFKFNFIFQVSLVASAGFEESF